MAVTVNTTIYLNNIEIKKLTDAAAIALAQTAEALRTEVVQGEVMPRDSGHLQNESTFVDMTDASNGHVAIVSATPYARRLYFHPEYNFQTWENAFAGGEWFKPWLPGGPQGDFIATAYAELYRRRLRS